MMIMARQAFDHLKQMQIVNKKFSKKTKICGLWRREEGGKETLLLPQPRRASVNFSESVQQKFTRTYGTIFGIFQCKSPNNIFCRTEYGILPCPWVQ